MCYTFSSVQSLSHVRLFATPWTTARQASLSITNSRSPPKPMSIESVMPCNHLILSSVLFLPSIFPSIRIFSNESALHIRWPNYWSFSFNISPLSKLRLSLFCLKKKTKQNLVCVLCVYVHTDLIVASISSTTISKNHKQNRIFKEKPFINLEHLKEFHGSACEKHEYTR